jgi:hypothetical protein
MGWQSSSPSFETLLQSCRDYASEQRSVRNGSPASLRPAPTAPSGAPARSQSANPRIRAAVTRPPAWVSTGDSLDIAPPHDPARNHSSEEVSISRPASARLSTGRTSVNTVAWREWTKSANEGPHGPPRGESTKTVGRRILAARGPHISSSNASSDLPPRRPSSARFSSVPGDQTDRAEQGRAEDSSFVSPATHIFSRPEVESKFSAQRSTNDARGGRGEGGKTLQNVAQDQRYFDDTCDQEAGEDGDYVDDGVMDELFLMGMVHASPSSALKQCALTHLKGA